MDEGWDRRPVLPPDPKQEPLQRKEGPRRRQTIPLHNGREGEQTASLSLSDQTPGRCARTECAFGSSSSDATQHLTRGPVNNTERAAWNCGRTHLRSAA